MFCFYMYSYIYETQTIDQLILKSIFIKTNYYYLLSKIIERRSRKARHDFVIGEEQGKGIKNKSDRFNYNFIKLILNYYCN